MSIHAKKTKPADYPPTIITLADSVKAKRYDLNLTKIELAKMLNISPFTVSTWEKGSKTPVPRMMKKIIEFLGYVPPLEIEENTLGYELYKYRCVNGFTQKEIGLMLKMDMAAVDLIEKNKKVDILYTEKTQNFLNLQNPFVCKT